MTSQEVIKILNEDLEWAKQNKYPYISEQKQEALTMAIEALEQEPKWIPVTEQLPEDTYVLVWERHYSYKAEDYVEDYNIGFYWNGSWMVNGGGKFEVLAWMPLPEAYGGQIDDKR